MHEGPIEPEVRRGSSTRVIRCFITPLFSVPSLAPHVHFCEQAMVPSCDPIQFRETTPRQHVNSTTYVQVLRHCLEIQNFYDCSHWQGDGFSCAIDELAPLFPENTNICSIRRTACITFHLLKFNVWLYKNGLY